MKTSLAYFQRLFKTAPPEKDEPNDPMVQQHELLCSFQPIVNLSTGSIAGHEAFVRKAKSESSNDVRSHKDAARDEGLQGDFELACVNCAMEAWAHHFRHGQVFVNISAKSLVHLEAQAQAGRLIRTLKGHGVAPECVVFEINGYGKFAGVPELVQAANKLRAMGASIAMDDVKGSQGSLNLWFQLSPDVVKLDERLTKGVSTDERKSRAVRMLVARAAKFGCTLVAKSVEKEQDLRALRDLGVDFAQGYFLGSPDVVPTETLNLRARNVIAQDWQDGSSDPA